MPGKKLDFDNLELRLLIAGEIEIITSGEITEYEKNCRLNLATEILYDVGLYEWQAVKRFYAAILSEIEMGIRTWDQDISKLEQQMLMVFTFQKK